MNGKERLKYERPASIDLGRVAPVLGNVCSFGQGATDECQDGSGFVPPTPTPIVCVQGNKDVLANCTNGNTNTGGICSNGNNVNMTNFQPLNRKL